MSHVSFALALIDTELDPGRLADPAYFAAQLAKYQAEPQRWAWYLKPHTHVCRTCRRVISHTQLEVARDPSAHLCCGADVRGSP